MSGYVLDACAMLAFLNDEPGADRVEAILASGDDVFVSSLNLLEVCYDAVRRTRRTEEAQLVFEDVAAWPIKLVSELTVEHVLAAAGFKAQGRLSLADAVALGLAKINGAALVTSDHHEFDSLERAGLARFDWIR